LGASLIITKREPAHQMNGFFWISVENDFIFLFFFLHPTTKGAMYVHTRHLIYIGINAITRGGLFFS
jgi:hypothetical protein